MTPSEKLKQIAENIPKVFEAGKKAEYDAFWDDHQSGGNMVGKPCDYMFAGLGWTKENCIPKYDVISPSETYMMFSRNPVITDMRNFKKANGEKFIFNTTGTKTLTYTFYRSNITYIETIDATSCTSLSNMFHVCPVETIELLKLKQDGTNTLSSTFACSSLKNITIEGVIGFNNTEFTSNVLSKASLFSIINALSATTSGHTLKLKKESVKGAFGSIDDEEWDALVKTKTNWTITLT